MDSHLSVYRIAASESVEESTSRRDIAETMLANVRERAISMELTNSRSGIQPDRALKTTEVIIVAETNLKLCTTKGIIRSR